MLLPPDHVVNSEELVSCVVETLPPPQAIKTKQHIACV